jgi:predicted amidohydrolase YtcJ
MTADEQTGARGPADTLVRAGRVYSMDGSGRIYRALAVRANRILAVSPVRDGLDELIGPATQIVDSAGLTVLPAFDDTHARLLAAGRDVRDVHLEHARCLHHCVELIRARAAAAPPGQWIRTAANWHEFNLAAGRMPTAAELDSATTGHPVLVKRGSCRASCNGLALRLAGITASTPDPPGGTIGRDAAGQPTGWLTGTAIALAERLLPVPGLDEQVEALGTAAEDFAARGIGTVRDVAVSRDEMPVLRHALSRGLLAVRVRVVIAVPFPGERLKIGEFLDGLEGDGITPGSGDDRLRVWGLAIALDDGVENGALDEPGAGVPELTWNVAELEGTVHRAALRGWKVGVHAWGHRAIGTVLDVYERLLQREPGLPQGTLVIEHAGLACRDHRARAVRLGIPVTVQYPLLAALAPALVEHCGERVHDVFPLREWLDDGGTLAAGSGYPGGSYAAMASLAGMVTRDTRAGVLGAPHAITRQEAALAHTAGAARLLGEQRLRGTLAPGMLADLVGYAADPFTAPIGTVAGLLPELTIVGGRPVHDRHQLLRPDHGIG